MLADTRHRSRRNWFLATVMVLILGPLWAGAAVTDGLDVVTMKDGSVIYGEVVTMEGGLLTIKTAFVDKDLVTIKWEQVSQMTTTRPLPFHLKDGTTLMGTVEGVEDGRMRVKAGPLSGPVSIHVADVTAINPAVKPPVLYEGNFTLGMSGGSGNSEFKNFSGLMELVGRSESLRLSLFGRYVYGENQGQLAARNARGTIKLDFFLTKRFFVFTSAYFESDSFQDLKLRTALAAGPGYQYIEKGDFSSPYLTEMQLYGEAGLSYFNEDFNTQADQASFRLRGSFKWDWPIIKDVFTVYHYDEIFPSLENFSNFYVTTDQGLVLNILKNFIAKLQVTWRYNSKPAPNTDKSDTLYLVTFGYSIGK